MRRGENEGFLNLAHRAAGRGCPRHPRAPLFVKGKALLPSRSARPSRTATSACFAPSMETEIRLRNEKAGRRGGHPGLRRQPPPAAPGAARWGRRTSWPSTPASARAARWSASTGRESSCTTTRSSPTHSERGRGQGRRDGTRLLAERFQIEAIAMGNGTAGRETEAFVRGSASRSRSRSSW